MKFPYHVTHNGVDYKPNEEVPIGEKVVKEEKKEPVVADQKYNKTEINRMPINELKALAEKEGIKNLDTKGGAELKKELIEKFKL